VATQFLADQGVPVAFVEAAHGGTCIADWQPGQSDYTTMTGQAGDVGSVKAVLFQQGESDAIDGTAEAAYNTSLDTLANNVQTDLSVKLMATKIHASTEYTAVNRGHVNDAINTAWGDNANVLTGPDFDSFEPEGDLHFTSDVDVQRQAGIIGDGWWDAMKTEWY